MNDVSPLARYLVPLRRWWVVVAVVFVVAMVATWWTLPEPPRAPTDEEIADPETTFRATHLLIRNEASPEPINFALIDVLARQGDLTSRVLERMDGRVQTRDVDAVTLLMDSAIGTISVTTVQPTPELAAELATVYAEELQAIIDERAADSLRQASERLAERLPRMAADVDDLQQQIGALSEDDPERPLLQAQLDLLISDFAAAQSEARTIESRLNGLEAQFETLQEPAPVSTDETDGLLGIPSSPVLRFVIFGFLGILAGGALVLAIDRLDTRVRTRTDAEQAFGLPVVAELPPRSRKSLEQEPIPVLSDAIGIDAEVYRTLRLSVNLAPIWRLAGGPVSNGSVGTMTPILRDEQPRSLLVTSSLTGEGKTTTVANLAASFAESGQRVLVVDCDFRRPAVGELLGVSPGPGLRDIGGENFPGAEALVVSTVIPGVRMIRTGAPGIAPGWFLKNAGAFVSGVMGLAEVVIFDTGPITMTNEASALIPSVDATLLVTRAGKLNRDQARGTVERLTRLGASMAGVVLIGTNGARRYGYYSPVSTVADGAKAPAS